MILKVKKDSKDGSFEGDNGRVAYYWTKAIVISGGEELSLAPGTTIEIGGRTAYSAGADLDCEVELKPNGKYKFA